MKLSIHIFVYFINQYIILNYCVNQFYKIIYIRYIFVPMTKKNHPVNMDNNIISENGYSLIVSDRN